MCGMCKSLTKALNDYMNYLCLKKYVLCFVTKVLLYVTLRKNNREITCVVLFFLPTFAIKI